MVCLERAVNVKIAWDQTRSLLPGTCVLRSATLGSIAGARVLVGRSPINHPLELRLYRCIDPPAGKEQGCVIACCPTRE